MARKFYGAIDLSDNELINALLHNLPSDPTGVAGKFYYNTATGEIRYFHGGAWKIVSVTGAAAGGDLSGTYPNPQIAAGVIVDADVNAANKDGLAATPSMRTLGSGANQAVAGNDPRLSDTRPPSGSASGDLTGTYPSPQIAAGVIVDADVNASAGIAQSKIANLPTDLAARVLKAGDAMTGFLTLNADPTNAMHAATKQYVDLTAQGFDFKDACRVVSTTNQASLSGLLTIDGVTLVANDRVLLAAQTTAAQNGIYVAQSGAWTRATDMDASGELVDGTLVPVAAGTANADSHWICTAISASPWVPGTGTSTWTKFLSVADLVAGAGLTKTGATIDFVAGDSSLTVAADNVIVASAPKWSAARTLSLTGDVTGSVNIDGSANVSLATTVVAAGGKRYSAALTASASQVVTHNLNTQDVHVSVYSSSTPFAEIEVEVQHTSANTVTIIANPALPTGMRVVVLA